MEIEEFKFIYDDYKQQIKQIPSLPLLLKTTQKSTRKLECINLYSIADKRDFDLELEEQQIMEDIVNLHKKINEAKENPSKTIFEEISNKFDKVKEKNIETFDILNRQDELLTEQIEIAQYMIEEDHHNDQIKEEDEYEDEPMRQNKTNDENYDINSRINSLKKQIDDIIHKIGKINNGRGKWFQSDHNDFVKIYNKCGGNDKRIIEEGVKVLGMKNTEIMDHLEIYQNYLQLEKEKKLISEEYRQIKLYNKMQQDEKKMAKDKALQQAKKLKKEKEIEENEKKKQQIQKFKDKKNEEKIKMLEEKEKEQKAKIVKIPVPPSKKKQIVERNKKFIEAKQINFKKAQEKIEQEAKMAAQAALTRTAHSRNKYGSTSKINGAKINSIKSIEGKSIEKKI